MESTKKVFLLALLWLLISDLAVYALTRQYPMSAPVQSSSIKVYLDIGCTLELQPNVEYTWTEEVYNGKILSVYVKNTSPTPTQVSPSIFNAINCTITLSPNSPFNLDPNIIQQLNMTFTITVPDANAVSWVLKLD